MFVCLFFRLETGDQSTFSVCFRCPSFILFLPEKEQQQQLWTDEIKKNIPSSFQSQLILFKGENEKSIPIRTKTTINNNYKKKNITQCVLVFVYHSYRFFSFFFFFSLLIGACECVYLSIYFILHLLFFLCIYILKKKIESKCATRWARFIVHSDI